MNVLVRNPVGDEPLLKDTRSQPLLLVVVVAKQQQQQQCSGADLLELFCAPCKARYRFRATAETFPERGSLVGYIKRYRKYTTHYCYCYCYCPGWRSLTKLV